MSRLSWRRLLLILLFFGAMLTLRDSLVDTYVIYAAASFQQALMYNALAWGLWLPMVPLLAAAVKWILNRISRSRIAAFVLVSFCAAALHLFIHRTLLHSHITLLRLTWGALTAGVLMAFFAARHFHDQFLETSLAAAAAEKELERADIEAMRETLDPDLLFRDFHHVASMMGEQAEEADLRLTEVADRLRASLRRSTEILKDQAGIRMKQPARYPASISGLGARLFLFFLLIGTAMTLARLLDDRWIRMTHTNPTDLVNIWLSWLGVALLIPFISWVNRRYPASSPKWIPVHVAGCFLFFNFIAVPLMMFSMPPSSWLSSMPALLGIGLARGFKADVYGMVLIGILWLEYRGRAAKEAARTARIQASLLQSQKLTLQMQLHPHFLFNALNAVIELIHQDCEKAKSMLLRLESFFRMTLTPEPGRFVPLHMELSFLRHYLEMEQIRFDKRLLVNWNIDPDTLQDPVPPLLLQPLVENAVRHGIAPFPGGGVIEITSVRKGRTLQLVVRDRSAGRKQEQQAPAAERGTGIGLRNTRRRLDCYYGDDYQLVMTSHPFDGLLMQLELPC